MFNFSKIAAAACLCWMLMIAPTAEAALVGYDFNGTIDSGSLLGESYSGSFAYDNASLTNSGLESINLSSLTFNFLSTAFDLTHAEFTPTADFLDGLFLGVSYAVSAFAPEFALVSSSGLPGDAPYLAYQTLSGDAGFGSFNIAAVPLPASAWLFASGLGWMVSARRRKVAERR